MIAPNVAVTAAHCVADFGQGFYSGTAYFIASQYGTTELYRAPVLQLFAPTSYLDGSDVCAVAGIICENDVAIITLGNVESPSSLKDMRPGNAGGFYNYSSGDYSYVTWGEEDSNDSPGIPRQFGQWCKNVSHRFCRDSGDAQSGGHRLIDEGRLQWRSMDCQFWNKSHLYCFKSRSRLNVKYCHGNHKLGVHQLFLQASGSE